MEIHLNTKIFSEEDKEELLVQIQELVVHISKELDISTLSKIIVPDDFTKELIDFQTKYGTLERGHTKEDGLEAVLKVVEYEDNNSFKQAIFISQSIIAGLTDEGYAAKNIHYIQHELGHVHDNFITKKVMSQLKIGKEDLTVLQYILSNHASIVWSEYIANRLSFETMPDEVLIDTSSQLISQIDLVQRNLEEVKEIFKKDNDAKKFMISIQERTHLLFYFTGQLYGFLQSLKDHQKNVLLDIINSKINKTYYSDSWYKIGEALNSLYEKYPNWNDIKVFSDLNSAILQCWNSLFVFPVDCDDQIYVHVV